jgi:hypothetical protein
MRKFFILPLMAISVACVAPAFADNDSYGRLNVPRGEWLSPDAVGKKLTGMGYKVHKIEIDDGAYEFEGTNADGIWIEGHAHPKTGEILMGYDD